MKGKKRVGDSFSVVTEYCENPWNGECKSSEIQLYIYYKGSILPLCKSCWAQIANQDYEWCGDYELA